MIYLGFPLIIPLHLHQAGSSRLVAPLSGRVRMANWWVECGHGLIVECLLRPLLKEFGMVCLMKCVAGMASMEQAVSSEHWSQG